MANDPRFPPRHPGNYREGTLMNAAGVMGMMGEGGPASSGIPAGPPIQGRGPDPDLVEMLREQERLARKAQRQRASSPLSPEERIRLSAEAGNAPLQPVGLESLPDMSVEADDLGSAAPGTRHMPRYYYGDDSADKATRDQGGKDTISAIRAAEAAEKEGREEGYEAGITEGLKETEGEYDRKVEVYSQLSPAEMNLNYGGPRALTKPLYWENPKTGEREMTEAHKDYDPRKLKPVNYTDKQGRPRVKMVKVGKPTGTSDEGGNPIDPRTGAVKPAQPFNVPDLSPIAKPLGPSLWDNLKSFGSRVVDEFTDPLDAGRDRPQGRVGISDTAVGQGREHPEGASGAMATPPGPEDQGSSRSSPYKYNLSDEERSIADEYLSPDGVGGSDNESSGEQAAAGGSPQAVALQPEGTTLGESRIRNQLAGAQVFGGVPILGQKVPEMGADGKPIIDESMVAGTGADMDEWLDTVEGKAAQEGAGPMSLPTKLAEKPSAGRKLVDAMEAADGADVPPGVDAPPAVDVPPGGMSKEDAFRSLTRDLLDKGEITDDEALVRSLRFKEALDVAQPDIPTLDPTALSGVPEGGLADMAVGGLEGGVAGGAPEEVAGGAPEGPRVFGDPNSKFQRPGYTPEQLALQAATKKKRESKGAYADSIRHGRRVAKEQARNAPRFWYNLTGNEKADAAMGVAMAQQFGGVMQEQIKGRTAREQMLGQQSQFDKALAFKSDAELLEIMNNPAVPYALKQAAMRKWAAKKGIAADGGTGGVDGSRIPAGQAAAQLEQQNPGMGAMLDGAFLAADGDDLNVDIGGYGSLGDLAENVSGHLGGDVRRTNSDQLTYLAQNLSGLITSGQITKDNIGMVGPVIGAKLSAALRRELGSPEGRMSRDVVEWSVVQKFFNDLIAGRMPAGVEHLAGMPIGWS
ncbi:MAG: hypothetical protein C1O27_002675 [Chloroflexi bacterium]|nr:MAG: hypothetical protein C1O27_002675 [Chloroflexota bacterium]